MATAKAPQRPRFMIDTSAELRKAVAIRAARLGKRPNDVLNEVLEREFAAEVREAKRYARVAGKVSDEIE